LAKHKNLQKIQWVENLLKQEFTINQIQNELKKVFGSGMNNAEIIQIRKKLQHPSEVFNQKLITSDDDVLTLLREVFSIGTNLLKNELGKYHTQFELISEAMNAMKNDFERKINEVLTKMERIQASVKIVEPHFDEDPIIQIKGRITNHLMQVGLDLETLANRIGINNPILHPILQEMIEYGLVQFDHRTQLYSLM
jgi:hypothetical protein